MWLDAERTKLRLVTVTEHSELMTSDIVATSDHLIFHN